MPTIVHPQPKVARLIRLFELLRSLPATIAAQPDAIGFDLDCWCHGTKKSIMEKNALRNLAQRQRRE